METGIALRRLDDIEYERTPYLRAVIGRLITQDIGFDPSIAESLTAHVITKRELNSANPHHVNKAKAAVMLMLNFALEVIATKRLETEPDRDIVDIGVAALTKNDMAKIFALGEKRQDELVARAKRVVGECVISVRERETRYYGLLPVAMEERLNRMATGELSDQPDLPLATLAEEGQITEMLRYAEAAVRLAKNVVWNKVFNDNSVTDFPALYFARKNKATPSPIGGVWEPFLASFMVNVISGGWMKNFIGHFEVRNDLARMVLVDDRIVAKFVDLITTSRGEIVRRAPEYLAKVSKLVLGHYPIFWPNKCPNEEIEVILGMAGDVVSRLGKEAWKFLVNTSDADAPTPEEIDQFWRSRLFLHISGLESVRLIDARVATHAPWEEAKLARSLEATIRHTEGFAQWPEAERVAFVETVDLEAMIRGSRDIDRKVSELQKLINNMVTVPDADTLLLTLFARVSWESKSELVLKIAEFRLPIQAEPALVLAATGATWTLNTFDLFDTIASAIQTVEVIKVVISKLPRPIPKGSLKQLIQSYSYHHAAQSRIWLGLNTEERLEFLLVFEPAAVMLALKETMSELEIRTNLRSMMTWYTRTAQRADAFKSWSRHGGRLELGFYPEHSLMREVGALYREIVGPTTEPVPKRRKRR